MAYQFEHSVECNTGRDFAWKFWTNVENWAVIDDAIEWVKLDGEFAAGTTGRTKPRGFEPNEWKLAEVQDGKSAIIEIPLPDAVGKFHWTFAASGNGGTMITQRVTLEGEHADSYIEAMQNLEVGLPQGMKNLAEAIDESANVAKDS